MAHYRLALWIFCYVLLWATLTTLLDPTVPYDAVEALNWATNKEWGSPKNPWFVGVIMHPALWLPSIPLNVYWYFTHFFAIGTGMLGVWLLANRLSGDQTLAWLALFSLNLSGIINFDIIPYNDNYLLVMLWSWLLLFFVRAVFDNPYWWLPFGLVAALAIMAKYSTIALIGMVFLLTLFVPRIRRCYSQPPFYAALLLWFLLVLPNMWWLWQHDFAAFKWVDSQIKRGLNPYLFSSILTIFYPLFILAAILHFRGAKFRWPDKKQEALFACCVIVTVPLLVIVTVFLFHRGGRLTEWLQPFMMLAPPLLVSCLSRKPDLSLRKPLWGLGFFALLVWLGYAIVMLANIRGAGEKFIGVKTFSRDMENFWQQHYPTPLSYVGGARLSQWLTFYSPSRPQIITPWSNETKPNIYNPHLTLEALQQKGALLLSERGENCRNADFSAALTPFPGLKISVKTDVTFTAQPGRQPESLCVALIAPTGR